MASTLLKLILDEKTRNHLVALHKRLLALRSLRLLLNRTLSYLLRIATIPI